MIEVILSRLPGIISVLLILLPNLFILVFPPRNIPPGAGKAGTILTVIENIGRIGVLVIPIVGIIPLTHLTVLDKTVMAFMLCALAFYYLGWLRFFSKGRDYSLLFAPMFAIPVPLAVFPVLYFAGVAELLRSLPQLAAAVIFGVGQITISYREYCKQIT